MTQISTVHAVPYEKVKAKVQGQLAEHDTSLDKAAGAVPAKPQPSYEMRLRKMSFRQLRGEVRHALRNTGLPQASRRATADEKVSSRTKLCKKALVDSAFAVILQVMLDSYERGLPPVL